MNPLYLIVVVSVFTIGRLDAQEPFAWDHDQLLPFSEERLLRSGDLEDLSDADLRIARNEIFARHGYVFQSEDLQAHFGALDWYAPNPNLELDLSAIERTNVTYIRLFEESRGQGEDRLGDYFSDQGVVWRAVLESVETDVDDGMERGSMIFGRDMDVFRRGDTGARQVAIETLQMQRSFDFDEDFGTGLEVLQPTAYLMYSRAHLENAIVTDVDEEEWRGEPVSLVSFELYGQPVMTASEGEGELRFEADWPESQTSNGPSVWQTPEGYIARSNLIGEIAITPDGIVLSGRLEGDILYYDYDGWVIAPVEDVYLLQDFERIERPDDFFDIADDAVSDFVYPG